MQERSEMGAIKMKLTMKAIVYVLLIGMSIGVLMPATSLGAPIGFKDVADGYWAKDTILWGVEKGIVTGYADGTFKPNKKVSEAEFLAMLIRAYKPEITVSSKGHWAENYYAFALDMNYPAVGLYDPLKAHESSSLGDPERLKWREYSIRRDTVAELITSTQGVWYDRDNAIQYMLGHGLAKGKDSSKMTIRSYDGKAGLTRAEAVQFIKNLLEKGNKEIAARPTYPSDVGLLPPIELEPDFPFTEGQVWLDQIDDVVDGEFRFKLWNDKTGKYEEANYRLDETYIPELNKRVFNAVKAIVDNGGYAGIFYNRLEDGNGLVVVTYYPSFLAYAYGNSDFRFMVYEKPYEDQEKKLTTNIQLDFVQLFSKAEEVPYTQERYNALKIPFIELVKDEDIFDYVIETYVGSFDGQLPLNHKKSTTINNHTVYINRFDNSILYYNVLFSK